VLYTSDLGKYDQAAKRYALDYRCPKGLDLLTLITDVWL
jgi:hypothetical protein